MILNSIDLNGTRYLSSKKNLYFNRFQIFFSNFLPGLLTVHDNNIKHGFETNWLRTMCYGSFDTASVINLEADFFERTTPDCDGLII